MTRLQGFVQDQSLRVLSNPWHALLVSLILALIPYTTWLAVSIVALVTLRKGAREGGVLLLSVMTVYCAVSLMSFSPATALCNVLLVFVPCYIAACALQWTSSWRAVALVLFFQVMMTALLLHIIWPDLIMAQYHYITAIFGEMQPDGLLLSWLKHTNDISQLMLANYLIGCQAVGVAFSAILSLMFARSIQSQLYYPGGFKQEMLSIRGDKASIYILVLLCLGITQHSLIAMNCFPVMLFYFLLAGLSLAAHTLANKKPLAVFVLLVTPLLLLPFVVLPIYVLVGALDGFFNFRLRLGSK